MMMMMNRRILGRSLSSSSSSRYMTVKMTDAVMAVLLYWRGQAVSSTFSRLNKLLCVTFTARVIDKGASSALGSRPVFLSKVLVRNELFKLFT
jgi:hypothetical protein